jgi:8-oxo-dGTP diphosphatase
VLLADRPEGKPYAGYWEFPGGKIEADEAVEQALERELQEELDIAIGPSRPWVTFEFDYPHAYVELQFRLVCRWRGEPRPSEGQRLRFVDPRRELPQPLLPAAVPALRWLLLPSTIIIAADPCRDVSRFAGAGSPSLVVAEAAQGVLTEFDGSGHGWRGVWADNEDDMRSAGGRNVDFALIRSPGLAAKLSAGAGPLPTYLPAGCAAADAESGGPCSGRRWIDRRSARGD